MKATGFRHQEVEISHPMQEQEPAPVLHWPGFQDDTAEREAD
jgi:hypothetical protein